MAVVRAAGGLLWKDGKTGPRLAVIHRPHRKDWSLPKGKLSDGESWETAALREVTEETGCECRIGLFAGAMSYVPRNNPKIVLYWHMELTREGKVEGKFRDEIDEVAWLGPDDAIKRLDYEGERKIVQRFPRGAIARVNGAARDGLGEATALKAELVRRATALKDDKEDASGLGPAFDLVGAAEDAACEGRSGDVRALLAAARRMALLSLEEPERTMKVNALLEEAETLAPWRRKAIRRLLVEKPSPEALYLAAEIRDEARADGRNGGVPWRWVSLLGGTAALGMGTVAALGGDPRTLAGAALTAAALGGAAGLLSSRVRR